MQDLKDVTKEVHYENYRAKYITERLGKRGGGEKKYITNSTHLLLKHSLAFTYVTIHLIYYTRIHILFSPPTCSIFILLNSPFLSGGPIVAYVIDRAYAPIGLRRAAGDAAGGPALADAELAKNAAVEEVRGSPSLDIPCDAH